MKGFQFKKPIKEKEGGSARATPSQKERLFDLLIHDLAGPLAIASTSTGNLLHKAERYGPLSESQKRVLERVERNVEKAQNLLQEMVEILRSEEGLFQRDFFLIMLKSLHKMSPLHSDFFLNLLRSPSSLILPLILLQS